MWVSWNYYAWDDGHYLGTNGSGHINLEFDPTCAGSGTEYGVGMQRW